MAKMHYKHWKKYEKIYEHTKVKKKESKKLMQEYLNKLNTVDYFRFGVETGYITKQRKR